MLRQLRHSTSSAISVCVLDDARTVPGVDQRRAFYAKVWDQERKDLPLVYLWTAKNIVGMKKGVTGFQQVPDGLIRPQGLVLE